MKHPLPTSNLVKPPTLPPGVVRDFVSAVRDFLAEKDATKRDAFAAHQLGCDLRLSRAARKEAASRSVKEMFREMKGSVG
jgi:hypothetical protein